MYNHNKAQQSKNRVHISWDILYRGVINSQNTAAPVLEHQANCSHIADTIFIVLDQFRAKYWFNLKNNKKWYHILKKNIRICIRIDDTEIRMVSLKQTTNSNDFPGPPFTYMV